MDNITPSSETSGFGFYKMVVAIAVIILILVLGFMGWTMTKNTDIASFPKLQNTCPDYWTIDDTSGGRPHCVQPSDGKINRGKTDMPSSTPGLSGTKFDPNDAGWSSAGNAACAKKKWASNLGISWDTITNANYC
jgi:hypothetical protein